MVEAEGDKKEDFLLFIWVGEKVLMRHLNLGLFLELVWHLSYINLIVQKILNGELTVTVYLKQVTCWGT